MRAVKYIQNQKEKMLKIKPFNQGSHKDQQEEIFKKSNLKHTRANSFTTHQTTLK